MLCVLALLLAAGVTAEQDRQLAISLAKNALLNSKRRSPSLCPSDNLFPSDFDQFCYEHCPHDKPDQLGALCLSKCPSGCTGVVTNCVCPPERCGELLRSAAGSASCEVAKDCNVAKSCQKPKTCSVAKSCRKARSCRSRNCNGGWNPFCWWSTITDGAKCGWDSFTDAAKCGVETVADGAKCGFQTVTDGAQCGWRHVTSAAECGTKVVGNGAQCAGEIGKALLKCTFPRDMKANTPHHPRADKLKGSFDNRPRTEVSDADTFTMSFLGDPQLGYGTLKPSKGMNRKHDRQANLDIMRAITAAGKTATNFKGLALVGDLTEFGKQEEVQEFTQIYGPTSDNDQHSWSGKVWPMLGNHDYANNAGDKWFDGSQLSMLAHFALYESSGAAEFMTSWMRSVVGGWDDGKRAWSSFGGADHYDFDSMAYGWSLGNHRFVATHNYPTYTAKKCQAGDKCRESTRFGLGDSLDFLKDELAVSGSRGQATTIMIHDYGEHFCSPEDNACDAEECNIAQECEDFHNAISGSNVVAIITGHIHWRVGIYSNVESLHTSTPILNKWGNAIPLIGTGAPGVEQWTNVVYEGCRMTINVMASDGTTVSTNTIANCQEKNAWRIRASTTNSGWAWDVHRLQFLSASGEILPSDKCEVITSGDCCPGYEGKNAFKNGGLWGGRKSNGMFFIGLECSTDMPVTQVRLQQGGHFASDIVVQKRDANNVWTDVATNSGVSRHQMVTLYTSRRRLEEVLV